MLKEEERLSLNRAEKARLTIAPPNKKGNKHKNKFTFQKKNNQDIRKLSSSRDGPKKILRSKGHVNFVKERAIRKKFVINLRPW